METCRSGWPLVFLTKVAHAPSMLDISSPLSPLGSSVAKILLSSQIFLSNMFPVHCFAAILTVKCGSSV